MPARKALRCAFCCASGKLAFYGGPHGHRTAGRRRELRMGQLFCAAAMFRLPDCMAGFSCAGNALCCPPDKTETCHRPAGPCLHLPFQNGQAVALHMAFAFAEAVKVLLCASSGEGAKHFNALNLSRIGRKPRGHFLVRPAPAMNRQGRKTEPSAFRGRTPLGTPALCRPTGAFTRQRPGRAYKGLWPQAAFALPGKS